MTLSCCMVILMLFAWKFQIVSTFFILFHDFWQSWMQYTYNIKCDKYWIFIVGLFIVVRKKEFIQSLLTYIERLFTVTNIIILSVTPFLMCRLPRVVKPLCGGAGRSVLIFCFMEKLALLNRSCHVKSGQQYQSHLIFSRMSRPSG
jgi:hypothetical protein